MVCDRVAILDRGVLRALGSVEEIAPQQQQGVELQLTVAAAEETIRTALGERGVKSWNTNGEGHVQLLLRLRDQQAVDQCVDDLRGRGVSIIHLSRQKVTLEDAFLDLLADQAEVIE